jgi:hypothetical protein
MIMKRFAVILLAALLAVPVGLYAQGLTNKEKRHINMMALSIVEEYERSSALYDSEATYVFGELFTSPDAIVYCDLMGTSRYQSPVTLRNYIKEAVEHTRGNLEVSIHNVRKGEISYSDGYWMMPVSFLKEMSYTDEHGVLFSAKEFYGGEYYRITLNLRYDPKDGSCLIQSVEGRLNSSKRFPQGKFQVINKNHALVGRELMYADEMRYNGAPLQYNSFEQAIVSADFEPEIDDPDVIVEKKVLSSNENYDNVIYSFKQIKSRAKLRLGAAPIMAYSMKSSSENVTLKRSMAFEVGADIGTTFLAGNSKVGIYTGVALSISTARFALTDTTDFALQQFLIQKGGLYYPQDVLYKIASASESLVYKDIMIPLYFESEYRIGTSALIVWNIGAKAYLPIDTDPGTYKVKGTRTIGDKITALDGVYDKFIYPVSYTRNSFSVSVMANIGVDINLIRSGNFKNRLLATAKVGYEHGIMPVYTSEGSRSWSSSETPMFIYNPTDDTDIPSHSLISDISLYRRAVWLEFGIKIKM